MKRLQRDIRKVATIEINKELNVKVTKWPEIHAKYPQRDAKYPEIETKWLQGDAERPQTSDRCLSVWGSCSHAGGTSVPRGLLCLHLSLIRGQIWSCFWLLFCYWWIIVVSCQPCLLRITFIFHQFVLSNTLWGKLTLTLAWMMLFCSLVQKCFSVDWAVTLRTGVCILCPKLGRV